MSLASYWPSLVSCSLPSKIPTCSGPRSPHSLALFSLPFHFISALPFLQMSHESLDVLFSLIFSLSDVEDKNSSRITFHSCHQYIRKASTSHHLPPPSQPTGCCEGLLEAFLLHPCLHCCPLNGSQRFLFKMSAGSCHSSAENTPKAPTLLCENQSLQGSTSPM